MPTSSTTAPNPTSGTAEGTESNDLGPDSQEVVAAIDDEGGSLKEAQLFQPSTAPEMPEIQEHAVEAARAKIQQQGAESVNPTSQTPPQVGAAGGAGRRDSAGTVFDPSIHEQDSTGEPRVTKANVFRRKRGGGGVPGGMASGGKPNASRLNTPPPPDPAAAAQAQEQAKNSAQIKACAQACATLTFMAGTIIGGQEFQPIIDEKAGLNEPQEMVMAWEGLCEYYGMTNIHPAIAVGIAMMAYTGRRWHKPVFVAKRANWWAKVKGWWTYRREMKKAKAAAAKAYKDSGVNKPSPEVPPMDASHGSAVGAGVA